MQIAEIDLDVPDLLNTLGIEITKARGEWADACCPLHPERNPSFSIRLDTGRWICRHGDYKGSALDLVARVKGITHGEAEKYIKGLPLIDPGNAAVLEAISKIDLNYARKKKDTSIDGGLDEWFDRWGALDPTVMSEYWFERGFDERDMREYDVRFDESAQRIVWPIRDENANIDGFIARVVPPAFGQKYLYPKGFVRTLFPLNKHRGTEVVLVEGPLDAMWCRRFGFNALAMLGPSITKEQKAWLLARVSRVIVLGDNDPAGKDVLSGLTRSLSGLDVHFAFLPEDVKDPQDATEEELSVALGATWTITHAVVNGWISFTK